MMLGLNKCGRRFDKMMMRWMSRIEQSQHDRQVNITKRAATHSAPWPNKQDLFPSYAKCHLSFRKSIVFSIYQF